MKLSIESEKKRILKLIEDYIVDENFEFELKDEYIRTGIEFITGAYSDIIIHPLIENKVIRFIALNFIDEPEEPRNEFYEALLKINFDTLLGNFCRDLDGKIYLSVDFPIKDKGLTKEQFKLCLYSIIIILEKYIPILDKIVNTNIPLREIFFTFDGEEE